MALYLSGLVDRVLDRRAVGVAVDHDAGAAGAAQQLVERQAGDLGLDVPQRHVDGGDGRHRHRPSAPVGALVEELPDVLDLVGVAADQAGDHVLPQIGDDRQLAPVQGGVADAVDPSSVVIFRVTKLRPGQVTMTLASVIFEHSTLPWVLVARRSFPKPLGAPARPRGFARVQKWPGQLRRFSPVSSEPSCRFAPPPTSLNTLTAKL
jgi:hypothetical protein